MCQVPEFSLYTDVPVVYCARIVLAVNNLNEIPCCLKKQPGEEEEEAALAWWGGECDTRAYIYHSISDRHQTKHNTDTQSALRTSLMFDWNMLDISNCETLPLNSHNPPPPPLSSLVSPNNDYTQILFWWLVNVDDDCVLVAGNLPCLRRDLSGSASPCGVPGWSCSTVWLPHHTTLFP